jgi:hypothetical protein
MVKISIQQEDKTIVNASKAGELNVIKANTIRSQGRDKL